MRRRFRLALLLGSHGGRVADALASGGAIETLVETDLTPAMLAAASGMRVVADEETLPFAGGHFDLVVSCCALHWANDLPGALIQIQRALKPDGLFLAALPGGGTLGELREALTAAELDLSGGAGLRVAPLTDVRDAGMLLQRAGFALPVVDAEPLTVTYESPFGLLQDLRRMGEASPLTAGARRPLGRAVLANAATVYANRFSDSRGRVRATFELLMLAGWRPDPSQPQPRRRGSGEASLARALGVPVEVVQGKPPRR